MEGDPTGAPTPQVSVYTPDADAAGVIRQAVSDLAPDAVFISEGISGALSGLGSRPSPKLLIVDVDGDEEAVTRVQDLINMCEPSTSVVVIGEINDIRLYRGMREAGAVDYFFKPLVTTIVAHVCRAILTGKEDVAHNRTGRIVYVVGARGGCGATTIALRTALSLSNSPPRPVLLLDLDLQRGDCALQCDVTPSHALREALAQSDRVDDLFLARGLMHVTKRLDLMASLEPLDSPTEFDEIALLALLEKVTGRYRYVVVDVPAHRAAALNRSLHLPSTLLLVSNGGLASAREVARWRQWLGPDTSERTLVHVLNKNGAPGNLTAEDFARAAGAAPDIVIPYAREVAADALLGLKAKPACPVIDQGLGPALGILSGSAVSRHESLLHRLFGVL